MLMRMDVCMCMREDSFGRCKDPNDPDCTYGEINTTVVKYWKEHFDMTEKLKQGWSKGLVRGDETRAVCRRVE